MTECNSDDDCVKPNYCTFNEDKMKSYCIQYNKQIMGCLNEEINASFNPITYNITDNNFDNCFNFTRNHDTPSGKSNQYLIYRNSIDTPVDISSTKIGIRCMNSGTPTNLNIPLDNYNINCDGKECTLTHKSNLESFIEENKCESSVKVSYNCENENVEKSILFNPNKPIKLSCPVGNINDFNNKCVSLNKMPKTSTLTSKCKNPVYKIPIKASNKYIENYYTERYNDLSNNITEYTIEITNLRLKKFINQYILKYGNEHPITIDSLKAYINGNTDAVYMTSEDNKELNKILSIEQYETTINDTVDITDKYNTLLSSYNNLILQTQEIYNNNIDTSKEKIESDKTVLFDLNTAVTTLDQKILMNDNVTDINDVILKMLGLIIIFMIFIACFYFYRTFK